MNLCGGITNISEQDLVLNIPTDDFRMTPRRKQSSSVPSSSASKTPRALTSSTVARKNGPSSSTAHGNGHRSPFFSSSSSSQHPEENGNMEESRDDDQYQGSSTSRDLSGGSHARTQWSNTSKKNYHHSSTMTGLRSSNILMKKLESGFNVTWMNGSDGKGKSVNIATNSDKSCLRIRTRSLESREDRDGARMTPPPPPVDIRIKIRHIVRIGSEKEPSSSGGPPINKISNQFIIKLKKEVVGERNKFKFVAESLAERDTVVLAIRNLLDKSRSSTSTSQGRSRRDQSVEEKSYYRSGSSTRDGPTAIVDQMHSLDLSKDTSANTSRRYEKKSSGIQDDENVQSASNGVGVGRGTLGNTNAEKKGEQNGEVPATGLSHRRSTAGRRIVNGRRKSPPNTLSLDEMKDTLLNEAVGCNPVGCNAEALAAVEDLEIGQFAANQLSGPWCTDDVCTAGLKDLTDSMKGIFDVNDPTGKNSGHMSSEKQRMLTENYITGFLGDNKAMGEFLSVKDIWSATATKQAIVSELKGKQRLQNRARNMDGKATNKARLQRQMTFTSYNNPSSMTHLQTISSFDDVNRDARWKGKTKSLALQVSGQLDSSGFLDDGSDEYLYYDSDPGDARERTMKKGPRRAMADRVIKPKRSSRTRRREALDIVDPTRVMKGRRLKRFDDDMVYEIIEATKNESLTLLWHPDLRTADEPKNQAPTCVKLWVESGVYLVDGTFLLPKLTWLPHDEDNLHSREVNASKKLLGSLDLLDICRVRECDSINRALHPFAHTDRSFIVQTQDTMHLFEAQSKHERGRIVNGLKLVIARLASLLMLRDLRAVDEFFGGNAVPGEAPAFARTEKAESGSEFPSGSPPGP
mmetsp:Transcript_53178/g.129129  ORF Transcript_53178/g.129129 Transcript_53178/m.129129 type:complete len:861 (-) Transcript_53178:916-3498(-)